jgi:outer membrane receptor protein involved in Fe transport
MMTSTRDACEGFFVYSTRGRAYVALAVVASLVLASFTDVPAALAGDLDRVARFDIPAEPLDEALLEFGLQAHVQIMFASRPPISQLRSPIIKGSYTATQVLSILLRGTRLQYASRGVTITIAPGRPQTAATERNVKERKGHGQEDKDRRDVLEEVTVTGTYISGTTPVGTPLIEYSREAIEESGAATLGEFARQIPENFSGADALTSVLGHAIPSVFDQSGNNEFGGAAFNLNGIGPGATLTLLNGQRLAPAGGDGAFVDVSMIPLSAVERIEILPDGASAIYGSDAIAGVVNIITRKQFQGAETSVSYGEAPDGGAAEETVSQLLGRSWSTGNVMMTYEYAGDSGLDASQRDFIPYQGGPDSLVPASWRNSVLISGNQDIGSDTTVSFDGLYGARRYHSVVTDIPTGVTDLSDIRDQATEAGGSVTLRQALAHDWSWDLTGYYSQMRQESTQHTTYNYAGSSAVYDIDDYSLVGTDTDLGGADLLAQGAVIDLPGGPLKAAMGASFEAQRFTAGLSSAGTIDLTEPGGAASRTETSVYGELAIPVIGPSNELAWTRNLALSVAAREDHYSDFGSTINPKLGLVWSPIVGLSLRGSYGTSYRAPLLSQLALPLAYSTQLFPDPTSPSGLTDTLYVNGGNRDLRPERSRSFSAGPDLELDGVSASATYFHTRYSDRVGTPPIADLLTVLSDPVDASFITRNPPLDVVEAAFTSPGFQGDYAGLGPTGVAAVFDDQFTNLATTVQSSVDLRVAYRRDTASGVWMPSIAADRQMQNVLTASSASPSIELLNLYGEPVGWKMHGGLAWTKGGYGAAVDLNYVSGYHDQFTTPLWAISSWTTADLHLSYRAPETVRSGMLRGVTVALTVENVTNERPPYVAFPLAITGGAPPTPYDAANASPVGRFISLQVSKRLAQ